MKHLIPLILLGFAVALAVVIGQRMSTDAMAVVIGVAVGVTASIPTSLLLIALLRKERQPFRDEQPVSSYNPYPPMLSQQQPQVMIFDPAQYMRQTGAAYQVPLAPSEMGNPTLGGMPRLRVIGDDDGWNNGGR